MKASAWILPITPTLSVAISEFELVHLLPDKPTGYKIPKTPHYCEQVIVWEKKIIPLMDLARHFGLAYQAIKYTDDYLVSIVAYRNETTGAVGYGALFLNATPYRVEVSNTQACDLPDSFKRWADYANSCFTIQDDIVAILRLNRLFLPRP